MPTPTLHVRIMSPQKLLLDTEAESVSSKNLEGNFDILAQHANFISMIENTPITIRPASPAGGQGGVKPLVFNFPMCIIFATDNKVNIYTYVQPNLEKK